MSIKIAVIGSNSFSGSHFIDYCLSKNIKVIGISRKNEKNSLLLKYKNNIKKNKFKFFKLDINKHLKKIIQILKINKITYIVDFSGQGMVNESWQNPEQWFMTNIYSKVLLIENLKKNLKIKKYIKISTPEVYGSHEKKIEESFNHKPSTPYALSHSTFDKFLDLQYKNFKFPYLILRFSNFYGEHQPIYRIIPKTIYSILNQKNLFLHGKGYSKRSFIYIDDFCEAIYKSCVHKKIIGETINFSSNEIVSIKNLVKKICNLMDYNFKKLVKYKPDRIGKDQKYLMSVKKAKNKVKWTNKIDLNTGLIRTIKWYTKNKPDLNKIDVVYKHSK